MKNVLSIAGSDPSGGAGIQADLKTMCALGVYGMAAITAVTVQNTRAVYDVREIEASVVAAQIEAVFEDIRVDAVKVGMVSSAGIIRAIRDCLTKQGARNIVIDPVMVSKSGCRILRADATRALRELIAIADITTPNIPEAEILCGFPIENEADARRAAETIAGLGAQSVLIKGGHLPGETAEDILFADGVFTVLRAARINTRHTHGTGCTLSSAVASRLACGDDVQTAVRAAKDYVTQAIGDAYAVGTGIGPVGHMAALYRRAGMDAETPRETARANAEREV
ncbi:MAG: bifunctional hydroxymethylpyrimidine kinase/phosphomethylpyrimidine kinase [Clostridiales Family XIII bacterium]|jgi:hydroxymethylpyrimidine/phosphomethylpyrimidine kinase|nr:bifunctional hydroxymethylpyrimidine kinase/phosphomethylpyrimidine kinase [Clostridiales Family XIII bacterium]